jgi:two-component system response regulator CpxR
MNNISTHIQNNNQVIVNSKFFSLNKKRILIVDSDAEYVQPLDAFLTREGFEIKVCSDGIQALQEANKAQYQLIFLDIVMPNLNGFELLRKLRASQKTPVVIMTSRDDLFDKIYGLEIGADDYLIKPVNPRELLARINVISRRMQKFDNLRINEVANINDISLCQSTREVYCRGEVLNLTGYEFEVLHYLVLNAGNIVSKDNIGKYVHGRAVPYNDRSIDMHISNIRKKISTFVSDQKIKTIRGAGYIFLKQAV